jgi:hypothetical protein
VTTLQSFHLRSPYRSVLIADQVLRDRTKLEANQTNKVFNIQSVQMQSIITSISRHCTMFDPGPVRIRFRQNNRNLQPAIIEIRAECENAAALINLPSSSHFARPLSS